jgi:hypothetical protein
MDNIKILRFNLISPICYIPISDADPFAYNAENGETLFCFDLDESQRLSFEPDKSKLFGPLVFSGKAVDDSSAKAGAEAGFLELPSGHYLFAQKRELLCQNDISDMALEIQAEGLWQRLKIGKRLYLRYLFEDGSVVTQLFRSYAD